MEVRVGAPSINWDIWSDWAIAHFSVQVVGELEDVKLVIERLQVLLALDSE